MKTEPLTPAMIDTLRTEAAAAGDTYQVALCDYAAAGDRSARVECVRVINEARAMTNGAPFVSVVPDGDLPPVAVLAAELDALEPEPREVANIRALYTAVIHSDVFLTPAAASHHLSHAETWERLTELATAVDEYPGCSEVWGMGEYEVADLAELLVGAYWAATDCHGGMASPGYAALCALGSVYEPGQGETGPEPYTGAARAYDAIVAHVTG